MQIKQHHGKNKCQENCVLGCQRDGGNMAKKHSDLNLAAAESLMSNSIEKWSGKQNLI